MRAVFLLILGLSFSLMADLALSACSIGFETRPDGCLDVDECADKERPVCGSNAVCFNSNGSYYCQCDSGYRTRSRAVNFTRDSCGDINDCTEMKNYCGPNTKCKNTVGSYSCSCKQGFVSSNGTEAFLATDGITCKDVDECSAVRSICGKGGDCTNTEGSYKCICKSGFINYGIDLAKCVDINECNETRDYCGPNTTCQNTIGSYSCSCKQGFVSSNGTEAFLATDGITCKDVDECSSDMLICGEGGNCTNTKGSYKCICKSGFINYGIDLAKCIELPYKHFAPVGSHDQIPAGLEKVLSLTRDGCNALNGSPRPAGGQLCGETLLESLLTKIDKLLSAGPLKDNRMVTHFLKVVEDALWRIAHLLPNNRTRKSTDHTDMFFLVERGQMSPKGKISLSTEHVHLDTHWETAAGDTTYPGFAAVALMTYKGLESSTNDSFQGLSAEHKGTKFSMNSKVVTVSVSNANTGHLQKPVTLTFSHLQGTEENRSHSCVYWDGASTGGGWSERGCEVVRSNSTHTVCSCSHLGSFAVLMALYKVEDAFHLEVITWVGLSVSQVCLLLCIVTFFCCRSIQGTRNTIHLHLCVCLFIANLVFLAGISSTQNKVGCALVAGLLHFFFLAAFCWMCLEGVQLYRMVVLVFNTTLHPRCMTAAGYGIPAIIVAISAGVRSEGYGTERVCWLTSKQGLIWSFFGPVCIIITVNVFFFLITVWKLAEKFSSLNPDFSNLRKIKTFTVTAVVQLCVLGNMWIFGYFLFEKGNRPLECIFTVLNSLQGALLFLMHCLLSKQVREEYGKFLSHLCTSQKKYSEFSTNQSGSSRASKSAQHTGESRI
ncbi:adhesion G protein-coupled receptor E5-like isoform X2 [Anguilla rostrata]|uniref:adhesion G protein-coupled receptor E5-like isoform X2 n=1 Tax=Anguilla rostrata TaxID=7938 RepID=UPI0030D32984